MLAIKVIVTNLKKLKEDLTMALTDEGNNMIMPVAPLNNGGGFGGFGGDNGWWIVLLILLFAGGFNNGGYGNGANGGALYPWMNQANLTGEGFQNQMLNDNITSIRDGVQGISTQLCNGFSGVNAAVSGAQNAISAQLYGNQLADLERSFAAQTANAQGMNAIQAQLAQCCCENRTATADLKYTVATENCADRAALSDGVRDIIAATQAQTQAILTQLCNDKIEQKNDTINQLRQELLYARGQASQDVQTSVIQAGQRALANEVEQYVLPTPRPAYVVANPNCCTNPCGTNCGCGM